MAQIVTSTSIDHEDWRRRWDEGNVPWHKSFTQPFLEKYIGLLIGDRADASILVTLCGKTMDIPWLCGRGCSVTGVELSPIAVQQLFDENDIPYTTAECGEFTLYSATDRSIRVYCGDIMKFVPSIAGHFDGIWDCNALSAVNKEDQKTYSDLLISLIKPGAKILMTTYVYDKSEKKGAPFSIDKKQVEHLFSPHCSTELLEVTDMTGTPFCQTFNLSWAKKLAYLLNKQ